MSQNITDITDISLSTHQRQAIAALLTTTTITAAAKKCGVARSPLTRWLSNDPAFQNAVRLAEQAALEGLIRGMVSLSDSVLKTLDDALQPCTSMPLRLRASEVYLNNLLRFRELVSIEQGLTEIEKEGIHE